MKQALRIAWRWIWSWAAVGLTIGVLLMFARVEFMAESGSHPDDLGSYAFWIPVLGVLALVFGIASGLPFGFAVVTLQRHVRAGSMPHGVFAALCGAAGGVVASVIFLLSPESYPIALAILMTIGAVSGWLLRNRLT